MAKETKAEIIWARFEGRYPKIQQLLLRPPQKSFTPFLLCFKSAKLSTFFDSVYSCYFVSLRRFPLARYHLSRLNSFNPSKVFEIDHDFFPSLDLRSINKFNVKMAAWVTHFRVITWVKKHVSTPGSQKGCEMLKLIHVVHVVMQCRRVPAHEAALLSSSLSSDKTTWQSKC